MIGKRYQLFRAGVRGVCYNYDDWFRDLYTKFVEQAESGAFRINPFAEGASQTVVQGNDGSTEAPETTAQVIEADSSADSAGA